MACISKFYEKSMAVKTILAGVPCSSQDSSPDRLTNFRQWAKTTLSTSLSSVKALYKEDAPSIVGLAEIHSESFLFNS